MAFLRSAFITALMVCLFQVFGSALGQLLSGAEPSLTWLGLVMAAGGPLLFFGWVFMARPARTERHPVGISVISGLGLSITMAMSWRYGEAAGNAHIWAAVVLVAWWIYLVWYSPFKGRGPGLLVPGQILPDFDLEDTEGRTVNSRNFAGKPNIWLFYRGNWCPFCTAQIKELADKYREIESAGARVLLISPQGAGKHRALARRFEIPMLFMRDPGGRAASQLGILDSWGTPLGLQAFGYDSHTVMPTVIISDASGKIIYSHHTDNYRVRPQPDEFLKVLAAFKA